MIVSSLHSLTQLGSNFNLNPVPLWNISITTARRSKMTLTGTLWSPDRVNSVCPTIPFRKSTGSVLPAGTDLGSAYTPQTNLDHWEETCKTEHRSVSRGNFLLLRGASHTKHYTLYSSASPHTHTTLASEDGHWYCIQSCIAIVKWLKGFWFLLIFCNCIPIWKSSQKLLDIHISSNWQRRLHMLIKY